MLVWATCRDKVDKRERGAGEGGMERTYSRYQGFFLGKKFINVAEDEKLDAISQSLKSIASRAGHDNPWMH
jgi:hypothetical protein